MSPSGNVRAKITVIDLHPCYAGANDRQHVSKGVSSCQRLKTNRHPKIYKNLKLKKTKDNYSVLRRGSWNLQSIVHLGEGLLGLLKEAKDDRAAELALILVVVHLQDLLEGHGINAVAQVGQTD